MENNQYQIFFEMEMFANTQEQVRIVGNCEQLGNWNIKKGFRLQVVSQWQQIINNEMVQGYLWVNQAPLLVAQSVQQIEFKCLIFRKDGTYVWEQLSNNQNRILNLQGKNLGCKIVLRGKEASLQMTEIIQQTYVPLSQQSLVKNDSLIITGNVRKKKDSMMFNPLDQCGSEEDIRVQIITPDYLYLNKVMNLSTENNPNLLDKSQNQDTPLIILGYDQLNKQNALYNKLKLIQNLFLNYINNNNASEHKLQFIQIFPYDRRKKKFNQRNQELYQKLIQLKNEINEKLKDVYGNITPVEFIEIKTSDRLVLFQYMQKAKIFFRAPIKNQFCQETQEFICINQSGVCLLSEYVHFHKKCISPVKFDVYKQTDFNNKIKNILTLSDSQIHQLNKQDKELFKNQNTIYWLEDQFVYLKCISIIYEDKKIVTKNLNSESQGLVKLSKSLSYNDFSIQNIVDAYYKSSKRLIIITLDSLLNDVLKAAPMKNLLEHKQLKRFIVPQIQMIKDINQLASNPQNIVYIVTSKQPKVFEQWVDELASNDLSLAKNLGFACENGMIFKQPTEIQISSSANLRLRWERIENFEDWSWKIIATNMMEKYLELTEGTIIETRNYSLIWRYAGMILNEIGEIQAKALAEHLQSVFSIMKNIQITKSKKGYVEVKPAVMNLQVFSELLLEKYSQQEETDFYLFIATGMEDQILSALPEFKRKKKNYIYVIILYCFLTLIKDSYSQFLCSIGVDNENVNCMIKNYAELHQLVQMLNQKIF